MPVFTVDTELSYISAFSNSLMTEISRLETLTANKLKSDFISSISHEFRSPLHGILVSTEFLKDSQLDFTQAELVDTIQTCGNTLLDTINHVLDYTKVNSFNKKGRRASSHSTELSQVSNVALLCEEVIHGMLAANEYLTMADSTLLPKAQTSLTDESQVHVILDFEHRDWNYRIQTGAFRRIVMNIFGNAQKFTTSGFILVQLRVREGTDGKQELVLNIMDSGRGMSGEYMEQKLYTPFAQEDSFAPGVGLGLSIVWSIVNQVRGMIHVRSEVGKGTDVEIIIPLAGCRNTHHRGDGPAGDERELKDAQEFVAVVRKIAPGKKIAFTKRSANLTTPVQPHLNLKRQCLENYFTDWFGFEVVDLDFGEAPPLVDLLIAEQARCDPASLLSHSTKSKRILFVQDSTASTVDLDQVLHMSMMETISCPIGPYRLAKTVLSLLRSHRQRPALRRTTSTGSMPTEMASPSRSPSLLRSGKGMTTRTDLGLSITPPELEDTITLASGCRSTINTPLSELSPTPRRLLRTSQPCTPPSPPVESDDTPLHILAVDDNPVNLYLLQRYLSKRPQDTVVTATNGLEAVRTVRARSRKGTSQAFDVIFMDLSMPEMDGFEATRLIRHFEKSVLHNKPSLDGEEDSCAERGASGAYIAALTGLGSKRDREEAESCGFDEFLTKPLAFGRIGEVLKGVVDRKRRTMGFTG
jgi:signal transduction histidine kinase/CheY-like chemotaxis protein